MDGVYQAVFFGSIALLAIVITVYVLAVSLLGRAIRQAAAEQLVEEEKHKEDIRNRIERVSKELEGVKEKGEVKTTSLQWGLFVLRLRQMLHNLKLGWIRFRPKLLTANWGALLPGGLLVGSSILSGVASSGGLTEDAGSTYIKLSLAGGGVAIVIVGLILREIERVALTSDETAWSREKDMFKKAMVEYDVAKRPEIGLEFEEEPPFHIQAGMVKRVEFTLQLQKGGVARGPAVMVFVPKGFELPGREVIVQAEGVAHVGGYNSARIDFPDMREAWKPHGGVDIKAPLEKDTYELWYQITAEEFVGRDVSFKAIVE